MPKQKNNVIMRGTRGMFGKQVVFKERAGESIVAAPPTVNPDRKSSPEQLEVREKFLRCVSYAKLAIKNAATKAAYLMGAKRTQSAFNKAFSDAFTAPEILNIIAQGYQGQVNDVIVVSAKDDFKVDSVKVRIHSAGGQLIEEGNAVATADGVSWTYTVTQANANIAGCNITATAFDLPGNTGLLEVTI